MKRGAVTKVEGADVCGRKRLGKGEVSGKLRMEARIGMMVLCRSLQMPMAGRITSTSDLGDHAAGQPSGGTLGQTSSTKVMNKLQVAVAGCFDCIYDIVNI